MQLCYSVGVRKLGHAGHTLDSTMILCDTQSFSCLQRHTYSLSCTGIYLQSSNMLDVQ